MSTGCKTTQYPVGKPYAYSTKINIVGDYGKDEKLTLQNALENQLDDSLVVSRVQKKALRFIPYKQKVYHEFDTGALSRTMNFFRYAYIANGYFRGGVTTAEIDTLKKETGRLAITFTARPFKNHKIDTVIYALQDSNLQRLAIADTSNKVIHKGDLYSQELLNAERTRLTNLFRNNGYLKITRDNFKVVADTINRSLFVIANDPIEQANLLEQARIFDSIPVTDVTFILNANTDSAKLKQYYIGDIYLYPDNTSKDVEPPGTTKINEFITKKYYTDNYKNKIFPPLVFLKKGDLYQQNNYEKTYNAFNFMGTWQQVSIIARDSTARNDTVDFAVYMLPHKKFEGETRLEGSYNLQNNASTSTQIGNLYGVNFSQAVKNRNFAREAIQTALQFRAGVEFRGRNTDQVDNPITSNRFINSGELSLSYDLLLPKFLPGVSPKAKENLKEGLLKFNKKRILKIDIDKFTAQKTRIGITVRHTSRFNFFDLTEINFGHSYQFKTPKEYNFSISLFNLERKFLTSGPGLDSAIKQIPILALIYNDGLILGQKVSFSRVLPTKRKTVNGSIRGSFENSGVPFSFIPLKEIKNNLFNFVRVELDRRGNIDNKDGKTSWAFRGYAGIGVPYNRSIKNNKNVHLPFFKQFTAGGSNSMRAWTVRNLSSYSTRTKSTQIRDFYGDMQVEANLEYRFQVGKLFGTLPLKSALWMDVGNIWNWVPYDSTLVPYNRNLLKRIGDDIAIATGTSIRLDLEYFLIRLDFGVKLKTPYDAITGKGGFFDKDAFDFDIKHIGRTIKMQVGINYPF